MNKKKVLHLSQDTGGVKTFVAHILENANVDKFNFVVIAPENKIFRDFCKDNNVPYYAVNLLRGLNPFKAVLALRQILKVIRLEKPDLIHAHSAKGGFLGRLAAKIKNIKVIYTPHAFSYLPFTGVKRVAFFLLELLAKRWTTYLLAISYSEANRAIYELGFKKSTVKVVLNSIPVNNYPENRRNKTKIKIRMIGRLTSQKNHELFLEIAGKLIPKYSNLEFAILGAGIHDDLFPEIHAYLNNNNLTDKVSIERWGNSATSERFLAETDIYIMTSVFEGLPFSLLEAMSLGIPCVVTKVDGNTDVINNNENGFSCLSANEFAAKIELLINSAELRQQLGREGYEYVKTNHNLKINLRQIENLYDMI